MRIQLIRSILAAGMLAAAAAPAVQAQFERVVDAGDGFYLVSRPGRATVKEPGAAAPERPGTNAAPRDGGPPAETPAANWRTYALPGDPWLRKLVPTDRGWLAAGIIPRADIEDLYLLESRDGVVRPLAPPENHDEAPMRHWPSPLVVDGQLIGLAWIEGTYDLDAEVRAAVWSGVDWGPTEVVSPPGAGTQIALQATVLGDGSWLLAWSWFDGEDDDIVWSLRGTDGWTVPARLHPPNDEPDIVPAVITTGRGALAAWSQKQGYTYRVRVAVFDGEAWTPTDFASDEDSAFPSFYPAPGGAYLLYQCADPAGWHVVEIDELGRRLRTARLEAADTTRPALVAASDEGITLEWPSAGPDGAALAVGVPWTVDP